MKIIGSYPTTRMRRNRKSDWTRRLVQENKLSTNDLIWPIFIREGKNIKEKNNKYKCALENNINLTHLIISTYSYHENAIITEYK